MKEMNAMNQSTMNHQEGMRLKHTFGKMFQCFPSPPGALSTSCNASLAKSRASANLAKD